MSTTVKITTKGQVTIPKEIREVLKSDIVEFELIDGKIVVKPVRSVGGSLRQYAKEYVPLKDIRDKVWGYVVSEKASQKTT